MRYTDIKSKIKKGDFLLKTKKIMIGYLVFAILSGLLLAIWRTVLLYRYFDPYNDAFSQNAKDAISSLGYAIFACIVLAFTSLAFLQKREYKPFTASAGHFSVFASSLLGCIFAASGILSLVYYTTDFFGSEGHISYRLLLLISLLALFFSAIYFILSASTRYDGTKIKMIFSFFPALFSAAYLSAAYLSPSFVFSDSNDLLRNVSLAAMLFFFLQEARTAVYGRSDSMRFAYSVVMLVAVLAYNLPTLIVTAFWEMKFSYMTMFELVQCGAVIYGTAVAVSMIASLEPKKDTAIPAVSTETEIS